MPDTPPARVSRTLDEWLAYQETTNVRDIELGLDRVRAVWEAMGAPRPAPIVITVGGTNGKGSTVALLEGMLRAAGYRTGTYTSPHLLRYNERVRIDGADAADADLVASFERIESARGAIPQTYFEFGTLAAIDVMARAGVDVAILEVGLGGRLDAVNIIDADGVVITTIDLDHQAWLGDDRDSIGREKAGIARAARPAVVGELDPPEGLLEALRGVGAMIERAGSSYWWETGTAPTWRWLHTDGASLELPRPALAAPVQFANASAAIAALHALRPVLTVPLAAIASALAQVRVGGRLQRIGERPLTVVDVGHNPQAARALAEWLDAQPRAGRVFAVYGALADKDVAGVVAAVGRRVDRWFLAGLDQDTPRGLPAAVLDAAVAAALPEAERAAFPGVAPAWQAAREAAGEDDTVLLFGSFFVAGAALTTRV
ncbi:bifunctional tetrahydrofolate synthase/dihydrofolate synthase [Luteibacter pinisoli]|uniref:Dihydrofolate synthase/folylpolyglutamate synthase n=1 Tax=Luteibacter pinisoli TaxID=2589080 RepID=A0A4Y5Z4D0_9GAMM|nr:bifunctional tetrahydrofolate synthase/dihydrofolate synthase [Luteibacter pinisoli]QDE40242.1 bifunctional tetrahydrofolate synthase/dihydrofolate synthase [Luteibacter pinisoli]